VTERTSPWPVTRPLHCNGNPIASAAAVCLQVALHGDVPCGLHGGPLLGVALKRMTVSGAELSGEDASPVMQFYSWNGVTKVGHNASPWACLL
jgi:hypothetical protein